MSVPVNLNGKKLFIDGSYYVFYRYYAIYGWYTRQDGAIIDATNIIGNETFMEKYSKMFEKYLTDLQKNHKISWSDVFFVKDCPREEIFRYNLYKEYKSTRNLKKFNGDIFKFTYNTLLPTLQKKYGFNTLIGKNLEADDVIALLTKQIRSLNPDTNIVIITDDNDYIQLCDSNTYIVNLKNKALHERVAYDPQTYLKIKIIIGDVSDNIPPIFKKCGPKTAEKLAKNEEELVIFFEKHPSAKEQFELNKKLIDFNFIDEEAAKNFLSNIEFTTT
jgi:5'-3' exonuclease